MVSGADGHFAVIADADAGLLAPDKGPTGIGWCGSQDGLFFGEGLGLGRLWREAEFAVDFVLIAVGKEVIEQTIGPLDLADAIGGEQGWEAFLPAVLAAFDFAFGLRGWGIK
jgi:hypothetical protein